MKVYIIPGYNSSQGAETVDRLIPLLVGYEVEDISYAGAEAGPIRQLYRTKSHHNQQAGERIASKIMAENVPVIIVAHSNGVAITSYIIEALERWRGLQLAQRCILIHGALRKGYEWPIPVVNFYGSDPVLNYGAVARSAYSHLKCGIKRLIGRGCTGSRWGNYGAHPDLNSLSVINIKTVPGHSEIFKTTDGVKSILQEIIK